MALGVKNPPTSAGDIREVGLISGLGRAPGVGNGSPPPVFLPGKSHGQRSLAGYSPWDRKESERTEGLTKIRVGMILAVIISWLLSCYL